jgi:serine-type D-Ala-D-Ala carboxypeptidase/endopeptidase (penicillin-binding protein 4)
MYRFLKGTIIFLLTLSDFALAQDNLKTSLQITLNSTGKSAVGISVVSLNENREIFGYRENELFKPASVMKLFPTALALRQFGANHTFSLDFRTSGRPPILESLFITGSGDPTLTTEDLWVIARNIYLRGVTHIKNIYIDPQLTSFRIRSGSNPYQAPVSGLVYNYNSQSIIACPVNGAVKVQRDPWEYNVAIASNVRKSSAISGTININEGDVVTGNIGIATNNSDGCGLAYQSVKDPIKYFSETLVGFLKYLGIATNSTNIGKINAPYLLYRHNSKSLGEIIQVMNHYSNNVIAEHLTYLIGLHSYSQGVKKLTGFINSLGANRAIALDGSGLSHQNRVTPAQLTTLLQSVYANPHSRTDFVASLPSAGISGTLKDWYWRNPTVAIRAKTGTIDGVRALAGYVLDSSNNGYAFSILQNGVGRDQGIKFEQRFLQTLVVNGRMK